MKKEPLPLDDPRRLEEIREKIVGKPSLRRFYLEMYSRYRDCLAKCPTAGIALELGSGASFVKEAIPAVMTSDTLPYAGIDQVVDATRMPFPDGSLRALFLMNVFHHIPDVEAFLGEARRCLAPGGRLLIIDQYPGWLGRWIYRRLHHEPFDQDAREWRFETKGPLSGANGALAWIVFVRDRSRFERLFPELKLADLRPHSPLRYWLAGGLKNWCLLPGWAFGPASRLDRALIRLSPQWASFMDVELVRCPAPGGEQRTPAR